MNKHWIGFVEVFSLIDKKISYRIFGFNVGKCSSQLQTVSGPGHEQNHHNGLAGSHQRSFLLKNWLWNIIRNKININKIILTWDNDRIRWRRHVIYSRIIDILL